MAENTKAGNSRRLFNLFHTEFIDRHCRPLVVDTKITVALKAAALSACHCRVVIVCYWLSGVGCRVLTVVVPKMRCCHCHFPLGLGETYRFGKLTFIGDTVYMLNFFTVLVVSYWFTV
jgi:hypothetical protein